MKTETLLSFVEAPRALAVYGTPPTYHQLWKAAVAGRIPAVRDGGKWAIRESDLAAVAHALSK